MQRLAGDQGLRAIDEAADRLAGIKFLAFAHEVARDPALLSRSRGRLREGWTTGACQQQGDMQHSPHHGLLPGASVSSAPAAIARPFRGSVKRSLHRRRTHQSRTSSDGAFVHRQPSLAHSARYSCDVAGCAAFRLNLQQQLWINLNSLLCDDMLKMPQLRRKQVRDATVLVEACPGNGLNFDGLHSSSPANRAAGTLSVSARLPKLGADIKSGAIVVGPLSCQ